MPLIKESAWRGDELLKKAMYHKNRNIAFYISNNIQTIIMQVGFISIFAEKTVGLIPFDDSCCWCIYLRYNHSS